MILLATAGYAILYAGRSDPSTTDKSSVGVSACVQSLSHTDFFDREVKVEVKIFVGKKSIELSRTGSKPDQRYFASITVHDNGACSWTVSLPKNYSMSLEPDRFTVMEAFLKSELSLHNRPFKYRLSLTPFNADETDWLLLLRLYPLNVVDNYVSLVAKKRGSTYVFSD